MMRAGAAVVLLLLAGCSTDILRTSGQAMDVALASVCARAEVPLMSGETMPTTWRVERVGAWWHVWLPPDRNGPDTDKGAWLKGAWLNAKDGTLDHCEVRLFAQAPPPGQIRP